MEPQKKERLEKAGFKVGTVKQFLVAKLGASEQEAEEVVNKAEEAIATTQETITLWQFARWSYERDQYAGLESRKKSFDRLSDDDRKVYLEEAEYYINIYDKNDWPNDIMLRLCYPELQLKKIWDWAEEYKNQL